LLQVAIQSDSYGPRKRFEAGCLRGASQIIVERAWIWFVRTGGSEDGGRSLKRKEWRKIRYDLRPDEVSEEGEARRIYRNALKDGIREKVRFGRRRLMVDGRRSTDAWA
jgi:hypothetical protein